MRTGPSPLCRVPRISFLISACTGVSTSFPSTLSPCLLVGHDGRPAACLAQGAVPVVPCSPAVGAVLDALGLHGVVIGVLGHQPSATRDKRPNSARAASVPSTMPTQVYSASLIRPSPTAPATPPAAGRRSREGGTVCRGPWQGPCIRRSCAPHCSGTPTRSSGQLLLDPGQQLRRTVRLPGGGVLLEVADGADLEPPALIEVGAADAVAPGVVGVHALGGDEQDVYVIHRVRLGLQPGVEEGHGVTVEPVAPVLLGSGLDVAQGLHALAFPCPCAEHTAHTAP